MKAKLKIHLINLIIIALIFLIVNFASSSVQQRNLIYISSFGFLALLSIIFVLSVPLLIKFKRNNFTAALLANRRWLGIYTFIFASMHVILVLTLLFRWDIARALENPFRLLGAIAFLILALMAATSNDKSVRMLRKNWKRLHYLIYGALTLVIIHSFGIGALIIKNNIVRYLVLALVIIILAIKFYPRKKKAMQENVATEETKAPQ